MSFLQLVRSRYSARAYKPDPVPEELLQQVLEAACLAPTAANRQPFRLVVIHTAGRETDLGRVYHSAWLVQAPLVIAICAVVSEAWVRGADQANYAWVDAAIAFDHLTLAAADLGLGTCWIAAFNPAAAREVLGLPDGVELVALTPLGFPADAPGSKARRPLEELVRYEHY
jgi:nitroreductase